MSAIIGPTNPLAWAQFHLKGGSKSFFTITFGYGIVIGGILALTWYTSYSHRAAQEMLGGWSLILTSIQAFALLFMGTAAVSSSIKHDLTTGMIESHRLLPIPAAHVIAGYITAAPIHALGIFCMNLILGSIVSAGLGRPVTLWLMVSFVLLAFAIFLWTICAFSVFIAKNAASLVMVFGAFAFFSREGIARVIPGVLVIAGPLLGGSMFDIRQQNTEVGVPLLIALAAQVLLGTIFFIGALRKFKRHNQLALSTRLGLVLLAVWVLLNIDGILQAETYFGHYNNSDAGVMFVGCVLSSMLLALVVLANAAREYVQSYKRKVDDPDAKLLALHPLLSGLLAGIIISLLLTAAPLDGQAHPDHPMLLSAICIICYCIGIAFLAAWTYDVVENAKIILILWLVVTWAAALIVALIVQRDEPVSQMICGFSPPAALSIIWNGGGDAYPLPGVVGQALYCLIPIGLYIRRRRSRRNLEVATIAEAR